ncbi:hypothetical protein AAVH_23954 [Aphelenchoides avenae]|nr:hypothetical protein AAVH_23954 [Aphelenchus avenae]
MLGEVHERTNDNWLFCATVPTHYYGNKFIQGRAFGVPIDEDTESFMGMFAATTRRYAVLSACIYEKYKFDSISPKMKMVPSFLFRCVCNYDRCNRETEFNAYLSSFTANGEPYVLARPATQDKL